MSEYCQIQTAVGSQEEAEQLAEILVKQQLAACVQVVRINSTYRWQGKIQQEPEYLLLIKTRGNLYRKVEAAILENHKYQLPEILCIPIVVGLDRYLNWIEENTDPGKD